MRRYELAVNLFLHAPIFIGVGVVLAMWPVNVVVMFALYVCGLIDLLYAKMPLYRQRIFLSFGPSHLPAQHRNAYFRGYRRIALGILFNVLALVHLSTLSVTGSGL
jgi:hypothetical protein